MPPLHHRGPGIIGLLGCPDETMRPYYSMIVDGHHIHANMVRIAYRAASERCVLVTDGTSSPRPRRLLDLSDSSAIAHGPTSS
jgi:N-acetylglucosamine-6-phosphate deacetylase